MTQQHFKPNFTMALLASKTKNAQQVVRQLKQLYDFVPYDQLQDADVVVVVGGDGFMLEVQHTLYHQAKPVFGLNVGSVGFLLNPLSANHLRERIMQSSWHELIALEMEAVQVDGTRIQGVAFNEVSLIRSSSQSVKITLEINGTERMKTLVADGILLSTPAGSTAYNRAAGGGIIPLDANVLTMTSIACFKPEGFTSAIISQDSNVKWIVQKPQYRPALLAADHSMWQNIQEVRMHVGKYKGILLTDNSNILPERILKEQFPHYGD